MLLDIAEEDCEESAAGTTRNGRNTEIKGKRIIIPEMSESSFILSGSDSQLQKSKTQQEKRNNDVEVFKNNLSSSDYSPAKDLTKNSGVKKSIMDKGFQLDTLSNNDDDANSE